MPSRAPRASRRTASKCASGRCPGRRRPRRTARAPTRTLFAGPPRTDLQRRAYEAATAANLAAIEKFVEGTPVAEVDAAAQRVIELAGFGDHIMHRTGHGMGIAGHEFPEDMAFNYRPLQAGEVYSCEPGIYLYGVGGFRQDDTVIVGTTAPEVLTKRSKDLRDQTVAVG